MGLKIRISYHWRLFILLALLMAIIVAVLVVFQYKREKSYRADNLNDQLELATSRLVSAYERSADLAPYMNFLSQYYEGMPVRITVYDRSGNRMYSVGTPIDRHLEDGSLVPELEMLDSLTGVGKSQRESRNESGAMYLYSVKTSHDGKIYVHTAIPYTLSVFEALSSQPSMWVVIMALAAIALLVAYYTTRYLGRNVELLRDFAGCEDNEMRKRFPVDMFHDDELGDIGRQIVKLYKKKDEAIEKSEREHEIALHAVKEKSQMKRQLTNNISHELKTPIGIIKGYIDTIKGDESMSAETVRQFVMKASPHVDRLCNLLNDLSTITRLEETAGNIPVAQINFHDLVYGIANEFRNMPLSGDMEFKCDLPVGCMIIGNMSLLSEAIWNLVRNSAVYSHGTLVGVTLVAQSEKFYTFSFYDNGVGVDAKHLPYLFDRFYRVDTGRSRKSGGTGLGLPIVKNTIVSLGGTVSVKNRLEGGLEFMFTLPRVVEK